MSKKIALGMTAAVMAAVILSSGAVFAAGNEISYRGPNGVAPAVAPGEEPGLGLLEDYMVVYVADQLNISVEEIQAQLDEGLTLSQVVLDNGVTDVWSMTDAAREYAVEQLAAEGIEFPGWQNAAAGYAMQGDGMGTGMGVGIGGGMGRFGRTSR